MQKVPQLTLLCSIYRQMSAKAICMRSLAAVCLCYMYYDMSTHVGSVTQLIALPKLEVDS